MLPTISELEHENHVSPKYYWAPSDLTKGIFHHNQYEADPHNVVQIVGRSRLSGTPETSALLGTNNNFGCDAAGHATIDGITFIAVADGVGKKPQTDLVSRLAVQLALITFTKSPHVPLSSYYEYLIFCIRKALTLYDLNGATTLVLARVTPDWVEVVSIGDSSAIIQKTDGTVHTTLRGEFRPNRPFSVSRSNLFRIGHAKYYRVDTKELSTLILSTDGVSDNLFVKDIIESQSAKEAATRAVSVFTQKMSPTPYKNGTRGKPDDVTVARLSFEHAIVATPNDGVKTKED